VKAASFDYVRPASLAEVFAHLEQHGEEAKLLAGGQSLLPALNLRLSAPRLLIDIGRLEALHGVERAGDVLRIGALTRHAQLIDDALIRRDAPLICRAVEHVAHPAIRNRGTIGGSLANADPAAELPAVMLALDARFLLRSRRGLRVVEAKEFFTGLFATTLAADEVLTAVEIPVTAADMREDFQELARRSGDYALIGLAAWAQVTNGAFTALRLGYFAAGAVPMLARHAASVLVAGGDIEAAVAALAQDLPPHDDLQADAATRARLAALLLRRATSALLHA
jgi:carbon-monoxide dehydrogenase medium subunit